MIDLSFLVVGSLLFLKILSFMIIIRILMSWFAPGSAGSFGRIIVDITEPVLSPLRQAIPRGQGPMSMIDWSPLLSLLIIDLLRYLLVVFLQ